MARIDRLREDPKRLLQVASVLGREFSARLLETVWGDAASLGVHIDDLTRLEFLDEQGAEGGTVYAFRHSLIQEVAYDSLPIARRQALHAAVGEALETLYAGRLQEAGDRLAHHYARSTDAPKAVHYLRMLAQTSARAFAHVEAVAAAQAALAHVDALPVEGRDRVRVDLAMLEAFSLFLLGRFPEALRVLLQHRECVERLGDPARRGEFYFLLANTYTFLGELDDAMDSARRSFEAATERGDEATMGRALYVLSVASYSCGEPERGVEQARDALAHLAPSGNERWVGYAYWALAINQILRGRFSEAREACSRSRTIGAALGDPRLEKSSAWTCGFIDASVGDWAAGVEACKQGLDGSPNPLNTALGSGFLGYAYLEGDQPGLAIPVLETAVASMSHFQLRQNHGWFLALLADGYRRIGDLQKAWRLASEALEIAGRARFPFGVGWAQRVLGRIARDRRSLSDARAYFDAALMSFSAMRARFETARTHLDLAAVARLEGQSPVIDEHMGHAAAMFAELGLATYPARAAGGTGGDALTAG
jgi:tetratricopeptide (TPR) repeat protein